MDFKHNHLLKILPKKTYCKLLPHLKLVHFRQGQILHLPGEIIQQVYFPLDCVLSITLTMNDTTTVEVGVIGNRELLGINAVMGNRETTQTEYIVQVSGTALQISASVMRETFNQDRLFRDLILRYNQAFIAQISQTTACNRLHLLEQRLSRWLLEVQERLNSNEIPLTQEFISNMLGVRRPAVTLTIQKLKKEGCISYSRGAILIINQNKLENCSCECFENVKREYNRLLEIKPQDSN
ncbi:MAG: Crp/Fnr family transcriptional regulator [Pleurocapsa sp.]